MQVSKRLNTHLDLQLCSRIVSPWIRSWLWKWAAARSLLQGTWRSQWWRHRLNISPLPLSRGIEWSCFCPVSGTGIGRKEGNVLFNDALNTFYLRLYMEGSKEMFYLTTHSTHFIYGYMASDIWLRTILIAREETRCCHIGYSFRLAARVLLYAPTQRQDSTYHSLCYTSREALAGMKNSSMGSPHKGSIRITPNI